ncbi:glycosyltransferase family 39 protein [Elusimicrobiota bacterium]
MKKFLPVFLIIIIFIAREVDYISKKSPTIDEHYYISYGASILRTGDFRLRKDKGNFVPLITCLPLLLMDLDFKTESENWIKGDARVLSSRTGWLRGPKNMYARDFSLDFLYNNKESADKIIFFARLPVLAFSVVLAIFVFMWAKDIFGYKAGIVSLLLYTCSPNVLAHSGLVTEDLVLTCLCFLTLFFLWNYLKNNNKNMLLISGICLGLALNTKYSALSLIPVIFLVFVFHVQGCSDSPYKSRLRPVAGTGMVILTAFAVIVLFYRLIDIGEYFNGMRQCFTYIGESQWSFLAGDYSRSGFRHYFLYALLVKTPLAMMILFSGILMKRIAFRKIDKSRSDLYLLVFPFVFFTVASFSPMHIGLRHILPIYPFLFVFVSQGFKNNLDRYAVPALILWYIAASISVHPDYVSYFNIAAGGPERGFNHLVDSNLDWGQDMKGLKRYVNDNKISDVVLSYYGNATDDYIGFDYQDFHSVPEKKSHQYINSAYPEREVLAISVSILQWLSRIVVGWDIRSWIEYRQPDQRIGNSILIYDITYDQWIHEELAKAYFILDNRKKAIHETRRIAAIGPETLTSYIIKSMVAAVDNNKKEAVLNFDKAMEIAGDEEAGRTIAMFAGTERSKRAYSFSLAILSGFYIKVQDFKKAEYITSLLLKINSEYPRPYIHLGAISRNYGFYEESLFFLDKAQKIAPEIPVIEREIVLSRQAMEKRGGQ